MLSCPCLKRKSLRGSNAEVVPTLELDESAFYPMYTGSHAEVAPTLELEEPAFYPMHTTPGDNTAEETVYFWNLFGEPYKKSEFIDWNALVPQMDTGDILLHHGTSERSLQMQKAMACFYSHTAMIIKDPPAELLQIYKITEPCKTKLYVWEATASDNAGVRMKPWLKWVNDEIKRNGAGYVLAWRKVSGLNAHHKAVFVQVAKELAGRKYQEGTAEMLRAVANLNTQDKMDSIFCSELIAYAFKMAGLFKRTIIASNVTTKDWSYYYANFWAEIGRKLINGVHLKRDVRINLPKVAN